MRQHSSAPEPKWNRWITRCIFPLVGKKSSGNETKKQRPIGVEPASVTVCNYNVPMSTSRHDLGPEEGAYT